MQTLNWQSCNAERVSFPAIWQDMTGLESDTAFVKDLCRWAKKAPSALAKDAGLTPTTILRPFNGTATTRLSEPTRDKLRAKFPAYPGWRRETPDQTNMHGDRPDPNEKPDDLVYVRQVDISYAMGEGAELDDYPSVALVPFNVGFVRAITNTNTDNLFIATGHGESMEGTLLRSDLLMIDRSQTNIVQSELIWAIVYAGGGMVKRIRRIREDGRDWLLLLSDNPAVPPQMADPEDVFVVGKLIWVGRRM
jgi:phage repressor protein C with HTH and peptisase S24 domain